MSSLSRKYLSLLGLLGWVLAIPGAGAAEWSARAVISQEAFYDGNIALGPVIEEEVHAYRLSPRLNLRGEGGNWQADLDTLLRFTRLSNQLYDSDDQVVGIKLKRFNEKQILRFDAEARNESTRTLAPELDDVRAATRVERRSVRPSWTRIFNENNSLTVGGEWRETEYATRRFNDYEQYGFDATWTRNLNQRLSFQLTVYNSLFESGVAPLNSESETVGLSLGLTRQFDEKLTGSLTLGAREVDITTRTFFFIFPITLNESSNGFTSSGNLQYRDETWSGSVVLSRSLSPSGLLGELVETDSFAVTYERQLRPTVFLELDAEFIAEKSLDDEGKFERERWRLSPALRWQISERWSLSVSPRLRARDTISSSNSGIGKADGASIYIGVRYAHPRTSW